MTTLVNVRIEETDKKAFTDLCNSLGLSVSTAFNLFVKQSIREQRLPVSLSLNRETRTVIEEAEKGIGLSRPFDSVEQLRESLDASDQISQ